MKYFMVLAILIQLFFTACGGSSKNSNTIVLPSTHDAPNEQKEPPQENNTQTQIINQNQEESLESSNFKQEELIEDEQQESDPQETNQTKEELEENDIQEKLIEELEN